MREGNRRLFVIYRNEKNSNEHNELDTNSRHQSSGKIIVIAEGKFLGAEDSLENAWALASNYYTALVTKIEKKNMHAKILGCSMGILSTHMHKIERGLRR